ncbi:MAG: LarC family nickel insertion protein [Pseudomonadota bacterium]
MHIHIEPVGGVAGDMFVAAICDAFPQLESALLAQFDEAGLNKVCTLARHDHNDGVLSGSRFSVTPAEGEAGHHHRAYKTIVGLLTKASLEAGVRERALEMFQRLGEVEARIHGIELDAVSFHEVGAWDSIADIVAAAFCIEHLDATWSSSPLPLGQGFVNTAHGRLPVPAPATARLLEGMPMVQDELMGERITPTGAAILRHLDPSFEPLRDARVLSASGYGFGTKTFKGISNVLRVLAFAEPVTGSEHNGTETVAVVEFEVDDQVAEDLSIALENLRNVPGAVDVVQSAMYGKKGRLVTHLRGLVHLPAVDDFVERCFEETTTLGVRWYPAKRRVLERQERQVQEAGQTYRVKYARRPGGDSVKMESDDLAPTTGGHQARQSLKASVEREALRRAVDWDQSIPTDPTEE